MLQCQQVWDLQLWDLPFPFQEVGDGSCQRTLHGVPGMVLGTLVLVDVGPGLLEVRDLVSGPGMVEGVESFDVVDDHLVCRGHVFVAVDVVGGIKRTTFVMTQLCGQSCSECCSVSWCQALCLDAP